MRVAHVTDAYLPRLGGIEMQVFDLATRQRERGHVTTVITPTVGPKGSREVSGIEDDPEWVHRVHAPIKQPALRPIVAGLSAPRLLRREEIDVLHIHASLISPFSMLTARAAARAGIPTVVTVHSLWTRVGPVPDVCWGMVGLKSWPVVWTAVSQSAARPVVRILGRAAAVAVLPNGIDPTDWQIAPAPRSPHVVTIASVMRMTVRKRPMPLLRMLRRLRHRVSPSIDLRAVLIGDGPLEEKMRRYLDKHGMADWVSMPGRLDRSEIRELYSHSDLYVAPAELESFGIAALEARAAGLPVVASRHGGVGEFISDGDEGFLVGSDDEMVHALTALVHDRRTRERMAAHNRAVLPSVSWPNVLDRTDLLYMAAVRRAATPVRRSPFRLARRGQSSAP